MMRTICTYNIRTDSKGDGINAFDGRKPLIRERFPQAGVDIVGFQEMRDHMLSWMEETFTDYTFVGVGRDANLRGEHTTIAYRTDAFILVSLDTFWLSDTPRVPGTRFGTDQSACCRICTVVVLMDRESGRLIRVYNTHLDHVGKMAQAQGMSMILARIAEDEAVWPGSSVVLMGDFNVTPDSPVVAGISAFKLGEGGLTDVTTGLPVTFHAYHPAGYEKYRRIDYIFTNASCDTAHTRILDDTKDGVYLSDHYPVVAEIEV